MALSSNKDVNKLIKEAEKQGWTVSMTKGTHLKWSSATGKFFFSSLTPSDHRVLFAIKKDLRMNGFVEIKKRSKKRR